MLKAERACRPDQCFLWPVGTTNSEFLADRPSRGAAVCENPARQCRAADCYVGASPVILKESQGAVSTQGLVAPISRGHCISREYMLSGCPHRLALLTRAPIAQKLPGVSSQIMAVVPGGT